MNGCLRLSISILVFLVLETANTPACAATSPVPPAIPVTGTLTSSTAFRTAMAFPQDRPGELSPNPQPSTQGVAKTETLSLDEIYRRPIGPKGLEFTQRAQNLVGRKVRLTGYMVRQTAPVPYSLLLAPLALQLHEREYGLADDLPANTVHVFFARGASPLIPHIRGQISLEGILELGPKEEADGRVSHVRLRVAAPWPPNSTPLASSTSKPIGTSDLLK